VAGGTLGLWLARVGVQALIRAYPTSVPRTSEIHIDLSVLLFALGVSMATGVLFGVAPVAQRRTSDLVTAFKEGGDRGASAAGHHHIRRTLVVAEIALAVMLVIGAGLLIRTVYNLTSVDAGFDRSRLVTFSMTLAEPYDPDTRARAYQRLLDMLRVTPGVQWAAVMSGLPPNRSPEAIPTRIENHTAADGSPVEIIDYYQFVMGDYFETMGVPIVAGRSFEPADAVSPGRVVIINETLANRIWKGRNPIGQRMWPNLSAAIGRPQYDVHRRRRHRELIEGHVEFGSRLFLDAALLDVDEAGPPCHRHRCHHRCCGRLCREPDDGFALVRRPADRRRNDSRSDCDDFDGRRGRMLATRVAGVAAGPECGTQS
jgi:hypothetical protein